MFTFAGFGVISSPGVDTEFHIAVQVTSIVQICDPTTSPSIENTGATRLNVPLAIVALEKLPANEWAMTLPSAGGSSRLKL